MARSGLCAGFLFDGPTMCTRAIVNLNNVLDTQFVGSVIVNGGNGHYGEPGPGRPVIAVLRRVWKY